VLFGGRIWWDLSGYLVVLSAVWGCYNIGFWFAIVGCVLLVRFGVLYFGVLGFGFSGFRDFRGFGFACGFWVVVFWWGFWLGCFWEFRPRWGWRNMALLFGFGFGFEFLCDILVVSWWSGLGLWVVWVCCFYFDLLLGVWLFEFCFVFICFVLCWFVWV